MDRIALDRFARDSGEMPSWWRAQQRRQRTARLQDFILNLLKFAAFVAACLLAWSFALSGL